MSKELISLRKRSTEANLILSNFASRKRIHRDIAVNISKLFYYFVAKGAKISRQKFDEVFQELERLKYGVVLKNDNAKFLQEFIPDTSIKAIGIDSVDVINPIAEPVLVKPLTQASIEEKRLGNKVMIIVVKEGKTFKAFIDQSEVESFTKLLA